MHKKTKNTTEEKELIKILKNNSQIIERISNDRTKSMLDIHNHGNAYFFENDWQEEIVANYNFFITMVGMIEARIIDIARTIDENTNKEYLKELGDTLEKLMKKRKRIVDSYKQNQSEQDLTVIKQIVNEPFIYEHLNKIYADLEVKDYHYQLHQEFVNAYNTGSKLARNCDIRKVFLTYTKYYLDFNKTRIHNSERLHKTGNEKVLRKIVYTKNNISKNRD